MADGEDLWSIDRRALGFWSKVMSSSAMNHFPFENQFLTGFSRD